MRAPGPRTLTGLALAAALFLGTAAARSIPSQGIPLAERRSGFDQMAPETRAMQADDTANPGMLWVQDGAELFARAPSSGTPACAGCHSETAMRGIAAGTVWINRYGRSNDFVIPTGGYHQSGIGKDLGRQAVEANLRFKSVLIDFAATH